YIAGASTSSTFALNGTAFTPGTFPQETTLSGSKGFVSKIDPNGNEVYAVLLGGNSDDAARGIAVDAVGDSYVTGITTSTNFPITPGAFQTRLGDRVRTPPASVGGVFVGFLNEPGGGGDAFVSKINPAGTGLVYSTYLGGSDADTGHGIAVDNQGNAYV